MKVAAVTTSTATPASAANRPRDLAVGRCRVGISAAAWGVALCCVGLNCAVRFRVMRCFGILCESPASMARPDAGSGGYLFLRNSWRCDAGSARCCSETGDAFRMYEAMQQPAISPDIVETLFAIAIGFAVAGLCASGYQLFGVRFPSFRLLEVGPTTARLAAVPL